MPLKQLIELPNSWVAVDAQLGVTLFHGQLSFADMDALERLSDRWTREHPSKRVELVVIYPSTARLDNSERKRMGELIKRHEQRRLASATVVLAEGLIGATHRSVLTALRFFAPPPHPTKVFGSVQVAVEWLLPYIAEVNGPSAALASTLQAITELQSRFERRSEPRH